MKGFHHKWPGSLYSLIGLILTLSLCANAKVVNCKSKRNNTPDPVNGTCECFKVNEAQWSVAPVDTAPGPDNASVRFSKKGFIRPKFTWTYRSQYLVDLHAFFLDISLSGESLLRSTIGRYRCDVSIEDEPQWESVQVVFKFDGCCHRDEFPDGFKQGDKIFIDVHAVPMYNREDKSYFASAQAMVPIPRSTDHEREHRNKRRRQRNRTRQRKRHRNMDESTTPLQLELKKSVRNEGDISNNLALKITIAVLSTLLVVAIIIGVYRCFEKRRKAERRIPNDEMEPHRILVIGDEYDGKYTAFINGVVEKLKKYGRGNTEVNTNVRKMTEIGKERIVQWISRNISENDIVIIIIVDPEQVQIEDAEGQCDVGVVSLTLSVAESETLKSNFKKSKKKFLTLNAVSHQKHIPFCTQFNFENDLKTFFHHSLGPHYQYALTDEDSNGLQAMLKMAQSIPKNPGAIPKRRDTAKGEFMNNLGDLTLYCGNGVTIAPYVRKECNYEAQNGAISMECNSCKP